MIQYCQKCIFIHGTPQIHALMFTQGIDLNFPSWSHCRLTLTHNPEPVCIEPNQSNELDYCPLTIYFLLQTPVPLPKPRHHMKHDYDWWIDRYIRSPEKEDFVGKKLQSACTWPLFALPSALY